MQLQMWVLPFQRWAYITLDSWKLALNPLGVDKSDVRYTVTRYVTFGQAPNPMELTSLNVILTLTISVLLTIQKLETFALVMLSAVDPKSNPLFENCTI